MSADRPRITESRPERLGSARAIAHANIALIKYWGNKEGNLPYSDTISFNLSNCTTKTSVSWNRALPHDSVFIDGVELSDKKLERASRHLDRVRRQFGFREKALVVSENSFPMGVGIASSASGFAALSLAAVAAAGQELSQKELSALARHGSGSASRSIPDGFVLWHTGEDSESSYAESIYPPDYWALKDTVLILEEGEKAVGSSEGHKLAHTSPHFEKRIKENVPRRLEQIHKALETKDIGLLGVTIEEEARELHLITQTTDEPVNYLTDSTLKVINILVRKWRREGIPVYFTLDAGPNVHAIYPSEFTEQMLAVRERDLPGVTFIDNSPSKGAEIIK